MKNGKITFSGASGDLGRDRNGLPFLAAFGFSFSERRVHGEGNMIFVLLDTISFYDQFVPLKKIHKYYKFLTCR